MVDIPISLCVMTKNAADSLERCLKSASRYPFEIVVLDTGSDDQSVEIAHRYTKNVHVHNWEDDFALMRNILAGYARTDYVLMLDDDEEIEKLDWKALQEMLHREETLLGSIHIRNLFHDGEEERYENAYVPRLYKRSSFHFTGSIHEQLCPLWGNAGQTSKAGMARPALLPMDCIHYGYDLSPEEKQKKTDRNIALLKIELEKWQKAHENVERASLEDQDACAYILYQLGKSESMAGRFHEAAEYFGEALYFDLNPEKVYVCDLISSYANALMRDDRAEEAWGLSDGDIKSAFGHSSDYCFAMGLAGMQTGHLEEAKEFFYQAMEADTVQVEGTNSYLAWYNLGVMEEVAYKNPDQAKVDYKKAFPYIKAVNRLRQIEAE